MTLDGKEMPSALHVPRQAVFDKNGKNYVFVKTGERFEQREVKVEQRTESRVAISGVTEGTEIALVDPDRAGRPAPDRRRRRRCPRAGGDASERRRAAALAGQHRFPAGSPDGPGEPPRSQAAIAADDARA